MTSGRTLSHRGERDTIGLVSNQRHITHSYTMECILTKSGIVGSKVYLCLQEPSGKFGPRVQQAIDTITKKFPSVVVDCSESGKMEKRNIRNWVDQVLSFQVRDKQQFLLIQDSFTSQNDMQLFESVQQSHHIMTIPPGATKYVQPFDVYFIRQYKKIVRMITEYIKVHSSSEAVQQKLHDRSLIVAIHALAHNQISSPLLADMIKYAWQRSGYLMEESVTQYENITDICFGWETSSCNFANCEELCFIRCAQCSRYLCFRHFFINPHYHTPRWACE